MINILFPWPLLYRTGTESRTKARHINPVSDRTRPRPTAQPWSRPRHSPSAVPACRHSPTPHAAASRSPARVTFPSAPQGHLAPNAPHPTFLQPPRSYRRCREDGRPRRGGGDERNPPPAALPKQRPPAVPGSWPPWPELARGRSRMTRLKLGGRHLSRGQSVTSTSGALARRHPRRRGKMAAATAMAALGRRLAVALRLTGARPGPAAAGLPGCVQGGGLPTGPGWRRGLRRESRGEGRIPAVRTECCFFLWNVAFPLIATQLHAEPVPREPGAGRAPLPRKASAHYAASEGPGRVLRWPKKLGRENSEVRWVPSALPILCVRRRSMTGSVSKCTAL